jgi:hypothetical protein
MRKITVFYAWQSDTPQRFNRYLIRIALEIAARRITEDAAFDAQVRIDADTEGVPGQPPVTETILRKITECDIFAPDLTFVARTASDDKLIPNPNVMTEYGYALHAKSHAAMMPVMNTAFGPPEKLPFDMGHLRHPIQYRLDPSSARNAERRTVRKSLSKELEDVLRLMIAAKIEEVRQETLFPEAKAARPPAFFFKANDPLVVFGQQSEQQYKYSNDRAIYLRLFPAHGDQPPVGLAKLKAIFDARKPCPMSMLIGGVPGRNSLGSIIIDPQTSTTTEGITQGFSTGELWGINSRVFSVDVQKRLNDEPVKINFVGMIGVERVCVRTLENYVKVALGEMKLRLPFVVELGAIGLDDVYLAVPGGDFGNGQFVGPIKAHSLTKRYLLSDTKPESLLSILRQYFDEFYDLAACSRDEVLTDPIVAANGLPSRKA